MAQRRSAGFGSAGADVHRVLTQSIVVARVTSGVVGAAAALTGMAPPARPGPVLAGSALLLAWSAVFAWWAVRRGPSPALIGADAAIVAGFLLAHPWLVPAQVRALESGTGWIDLVAGAGVLIAQAGLRQPLGAAVGFGIVGVYVAGDGQLREAPVHLAGQVVAAAGLAVLLRRAAAAADGILRAAADHRHESLVRAAVRADERSQQRHLHDTVLATLTMVHIGGFSRDCVALRERAAADLEALDRLRAHPAGGREPTRAVVRLDAVLRTVVTQPRPGGGAVEVSLDVTAIEVPVTVATAIAQCVTEALTNVARHAGTGRARITGRADGAGVSVTVADDGAGFDVAAVPLHRRGLRESIAGRMRSVGGSAGVRSAPGAGTRVVLRWPDG